jgi:hypothetical protein
MAKARHVDIKTLKTIPILEVAAALGLPLKKTGFGAWSEKSADDPLGVTSLTIFENKGFWIRYSEKTSGGVYKGSVIDLVMHIRDCDFRAACEFLASAFPNIR